MTFRFLWDSLFTYICRIENSSHSIDQPQFLYNKFSLEPLCFVFLLTTYLNISGVFDTCWISSFSSYFLLNQFLFRHLHCHSIKTTFVKVTYDHSISKYSGRLLLVILLILGFSWLIQPPWYTISMWNESESRSVMSNTLWPHGLYRILYILRPEYWSG